MSNYNRRLAEGFALMEDDDPADARPSSDDMPDYGVSRMAAEEFIRGTTEALQNMRDARDD